MLQTEPNDNAETFEEERKFNKVNEIIPPLWV